MMSLSGCDLASSHYMEVFDADLVLSEYSYSEIDDNNAY